MWSSTYWTYIKHQYYNKGYDTNPINVLANVIVSEEEILQLVKEISKNELNGTTNINGNTALHLVCTADRYSVVEY